MLQPLYTYTYTYEHLCPSKLCLHRFQSELKAFNRGMNAWKIVPYPTEEKSQMSIGHSRFSCPVWKAVLIYSLKIVPTEWKTPFWVFSWTKRRPSPHVSPNPNTWEVNGNTNLHCVCGSDYFIQVLWRCLRRENRLNRACAHTVVCLYAKQ